jgi:hypothetical protein
MNTAAQAFQFATASYLTCVENQKAETVEQLFDALEQASDASIFYHTFQSLGRHHFLTPEGFSNDFAQWVLAALNQPLLAERLAGIDIRDYVAIAELRSDLRRIISEYSGQHTRLASQSAFEPFYFCRAIEVTVPLPLDAHTLGGLRAGVERISHASFYHHFIASRLRLQLRTNDFSHWLAAALGLEQLAERTNRIDIYTNTLDTARQEMINLVDREMNQ